MPESRKIRERPYYCTLWWIVPGGAVLWSRSPVTGGRSKHPQIYGGPEIGAHADRATRFPVRARAVGSILCKEESSDSPSSSREWSTKGSSFHVLAIVEYVLASFINTRMIFGGEVWVGEVLPRLPLYLSDILKGMVYDAGRAGEGGTDFSTVDVKTGKFGEAHSSRTTFPTLGLTTISQLFRCRAGLTSYDRTGRSTPPSIN